MTLSSNHTNELSEEPDGYLLRTFATTEDEGAFCELVRRHSGMIKATAIRTLGDHTLADEVTQDTLIALARKARRIRLHDGQNLGPWLHRAAVFESQNARRKEQRMKKKLQVVRQTLESANDQEDYDALAWSNAVPILDVAIDALPEKERKAIVLRFFENLRFRDIGIALGGMSPDAVRMLTNRAIASLSRTLTRKGVTITAPAIAAGLESGKSSISAANSVLVDHEMIATVLRGSAERSGFFLTAFMGMDWAVRAAAFCVGLGIPVAYSGFDSRSQTTTIAAPAALSPSDTGVLVPQELDRRLRQIRPRAGVGQESLNRLLKQIATLEDEYQDPASLSEAMQTAMGLHSDQFQVVWEAVLKEEPPALL